MGKIGLGELSALYSLYGSTRDSFWGIGMYLPQMMNRIGNAEKIFEFLDQEEEPEQWPFSAEPDDRAEADVMLSVRDVDFAYTGGRKVLERFSMDVKKGSFTGRDSGFHRFYRKRQKYPGQAAAWVLPPGAWEHQRQRETLFRYYPEGGPGTDRLCSPGALPL